MQTASKPLLIEVSGDGNGAKRGTAIQRQVMVKNAGTQLAEVDLWIAAADSHSEPVIRWCTFNKPNPLRVEADAQETVELRFEIPLEATPGLYNYEILVDAQSQYPDKTERRPQQLRVLPADQDDIDNTPVFSLLPATGSTTPHILLAGESLTIAVQVENRSKRVDRFYATCLEFDQAWISIRYPEALETTGLARETDGLELNPGKSGQITLVIHPPQYTPAGSYFPTVRLTSSVNDALVLLDVVYLQILPDERVDLRLHPSSRHIPAEPGAFMVEVSNPGNIQRHLMLQAGDREGLFTYTPNPASAQLAPGQQQAIDLVVQPQKWWRRPWLGKGLEFPVPIELVNLEPLDAALPQESPQATLVWQAHPWWRFWLLILLSLGILGAIAFVIWRVFIYRDPPQPIPKILSFENATVPNPRTQKQEQRQYLEGYGDVIRLKWQISHLERLDKVTLIRLENNIETDRKTFFFRSKIETPLLRQSSQIGERKQNNFCEILPATPTANSSNNQQLAWWQRFNLPWQQQSNDTYETIVSCPEMLSSAQKAGNYTFELQVFAQPDKNSKQDLRQPVDTLKTDTIAIQPALPPKIVEFSATKPSYQEALIEQPTGSALPIVTVPATPVTSATSLPSPSPVPSRTATGLVRLNWEINSPNQIKEVRVVGLAPDGTIGSPLKRYVLVDGKVPPDLQPYCVQAASLICQNVPTDAAKPGSYTFKLTVISKQTSSGPEITKATDVIRIIPQTLKPSDVVFSVDGQNVDQTPKLVYEIGPNRPPVELALSWQVKQLEGLKVELLPAPGGVKLTDSLKFPLGKSSSSEMLTLKVTTRSGEQVAKSVVIQTVELKPAAKPATASSSKTTSNSPSNASIPTLPPPKPSDPGRLSPIELPPRP